MEEAVKDIIFFRLHQAYRLRMFYAKDLTMKEGKPGFEMQFQRTLVECDILENLYCCAELYPMSLKKMRYVENYFRQQCLKQVS